MHLGISLFNKGNPEFMFIFATTKDWLDSLSIYNYSFINDYIYPTEIFEKTNDIETNLPVFMEYRWINSIRQQAGNLLINNHILIIFHASSTSNDKLITGREH